MGTYCQNMAAAPSRVRTVPRAAPSLGHRRCLRQLNIRLVYRLLTLGSLTRRAQGGSLSVCRAALAGLTLVAIGCAQPSSGDRSCRTSWSPARSRWKTRSQPHSAATRSRWRSLWRLARAKTPGRDAAHQPRRRRRRDGGQRPLRTEHTRRRGLSEPAGSKSARWATSLNMSSRRS